MCQEANQEQTGTYISFSSYNGGTEFEVTLTDHKTAYGVLTKDPAHKFEKLTKKFSYSFEISCDYSKCGDHFHCEGNDGKKDDDMNVIKKF